MKKNQFLLLFILCTLLMNCKNEPTHHIKIPEGIWIAKDYYDSFEKTRSAVKSKLSFDENHPVGLRINYKELNGSNLNIGYARLHDHILRPEVSQYIITQDNDTIHEQGSFKINIDNINSSGYYETSEIYPFSYKNKAFLTYKKDSNKIEIYRPQNKKQQSVKIEYIRIDSIFHNSYPFPNPLYFYTRKNTLCGIYSVKDSLNKIISRRLEISPSGKIKGLKKFEDMTLYFSTDIYCGSPVYQDLILISENIFNLKGKTFAFGFNRSEDGIIYLSENKIEEKEKGKTIYKLERQKP